MSILLAGGTGVIGQALLDQAGNAPDIITVGRRATERAAHEIVAEFSICPLPPAETAICVLGTTIGKAGSREAFHAVDYGAVMSFAQAAKQRVLTISCRHGRRRRSIFSRVLFRVKVK